jgi:hypothetical protein
MSEIDCGRYLRGYLAVRDEDERKRREAIVALRQRTEHEARREAIVALAVVLSSVLGFVLAAFFSGPAR